MARGPRSAISPTTFPGFDFRPIGGSAFRSPPDSCLTLLRHESVGALPRNGRVGPLDNLFEGELRAFVGRRISAISPASRKRGSKGTTKPKSSRDAERLFVASAKTGPFCQRAALGR